MYECLRFDIVAGVSIFLPNLVDKTPRAKNIQPIKQMLVQKWSVTSMYYRNTYTHAQSHAYMTIIH